MKRFFKSDRESDALIEKVTKLYGLKLGSLSTWQSKMNCTL